MTSPTVQTETKTVSFTSTKPQLFVDSSKVDDAVSFYKNAFGAEEVTRVNHPKRKADQDVPLVVSAQVKIGSLTVIVSENVDATAKEIGTGIVFWLETEDIEAAVEKAVKAGAVAEGEKLAEPEGEGACDAAAGRVGKVKDPYGIVWVICTPAPAKKTADADVEA